MSLTGWEGRWVQPAHHPDSGVYLSTTVPCIHGVNGQGVWLTARSALCLGSPDLLQASFLAKRRALLSDCEEVAHPNPGQVDGNGRVHITKL